MGLWSRIKKAFSFKEISEANAKRVDFAAQGYRPINNNYNQYLANIYNRDFTPYKHDKMQTLCLEMWKRSPVARRVIELRKNLIISEGFQFVPQGGRKGKNKRLEKYFKTFWENNCWPEKMSERVQDLLIYGELVFYCPPMNPYNGKVKMVQFNPQNVECIEQDRFNIEELEKLVLKESYPIRHRANGKWGEIQEKKEFLMVRDRDGDDELTGDIFYLPVNKTSFATRGLSDIVHVIDWLDIHSKILEAECERIELTKAFLYKCQVKGGVQMMQAVAERHQETPTPGSTLFATENEDWSVIAPQMTLFDTVGFEKYLLLLILGGMGIPEHWFVESGSINKATSANMDEPIFAWARKAKSDLCNFFKLMFKYCIQEARKDYGPLSDFEDEDCKFDIISRDPDRGAYDEIGAMMKSIGDSMNMYVASNWMTNENAGLIARNIMESLGLGTISVPEEGKNLNVELTRTKAKDEEYENLQKLEGMTNLVSRLFTKDFSDKLTGEKNDEKDAPGKFLGNAIRKEFEKARKRSEEERSVADAAKQAEEDRRQQIGGGPGASGDGDKGIPADRSGPGGSGSGTRKSSRNPKPASGNKLGSNSQ